MAFGGKHLSYLNKHNGITFVFACGSELCDLQNVYIGRGAAFGFKCVVQDGPVTWLPGFFDSDGLCLGFTCNSEDKTIASVAMDSLTCERLTSSLPTRWHAGTCSSLAKYVQGTCIYRKMLIVLGDI